MSLRAAAAGVVLGAGGLGGVGFVAGLEADHGVPPTHAEVYIAQAARAPCPVDYRVLAAIGGIESGHGISRSRDDSGLVTSYAGAQGDMQIMPATFAAYATDGDGDGEARVDSLPDSVATAAAYLCANGVDRDLDTALWNYNHSWAYVADVRAAMAALPPLPPAAPPGDQAQRIAAAALAWVDREFNPGVREQCMFFVRRVLQDAGVTLNPEVTSRPLDGSWSGVGIANSVGADHGLVIRDRAQVRAGDVVMFANTYGDWPLGSITHVGVAISETEMVDRPTAAAPVRRRPIATFPRFAGAVRLTGNATPAPAPAPGDDPRPDPGEVLDALWFKGLDAGAAACREIRKDPRIAHLCDAAGAVGAEVLE